MIDFLRVIFSVVLLFRCHVMFLLPHAETASHTFTTEALSSKPDSYFPFKFNLNLQFIFDANLKTRIVTIYVCFSVVFFFRVSFMSDVTKQNQSEERSMVTVVQTTEIVREMSAFSTEEDKN